MKKTIIGLSFALLSATSFAMNSTDFVKKESADVLAIVQKSKSLKDFKKDLTQAVNIDDIIDFKKISQITLGKNWRAASEQQRADFTKEFRDFLINFYGNAMFNFKEATINYNGEVVNGDDATVKTVVGYTDNGQKKRAKVDYILVKNGDSWRMVDIVIEGVTLTLSYKDSFGQVISQKGIDGLIQDLKDKNAKNKANG